jgi:hypothetical protein
VPDNGKVSDGDKVLSDGYAAVQVEYDVPPTARNKDRLTRPLKNLKLRRGRREKGVDH